MKRFKQISGDVNFWEFGGVFLDTIDNDIINIPGLSDDIEQVHGAKQEIHIISNDVITNDEWFDPKSVSDCVGMYLNDWEKQANYHKWTDVMSYYGWINGDQYPEMMNKTELRKLVRH